jgi:hypothetical protein
MATSEERARERDRIAIATSERVLVAPGRVVSWSGIWAGFMSAIAVMVIVGALGIAVGISVLDVNPAGASDAQGWMIGAGLWSFFTFIIGLFTGGLVATRSGAYTARPAAAAIGTAVWVLSIAAVCFFGAVRAALVPTPLLRAPVATADVPPAIAQAAPDLTGALAAGDIDRAVSRLADPMVANRIAATAGVARDQLASTLAGIRGRLEANRADPASALAQARADLRTVVPPAGASSAVPVPAPQPQATILGWVTFFVLIASLGAAIAGAAVGFRPVVY